MEITENKTNLSFVDKIASFSVRMVQNLVGRFLFVTILVAVFLSSIQIWSIQDIGFVVYLTTGKEVIGDRPGRLFGLLSHIPLTITQTRVIVFLICLVGTVLLSFGLYLFARDIKNDRNKIFVIAGASAVLQIIMDYYRYMLWDYTSVSLYIALGLLVWAFYFLFKSEKKYIALLFAGAAQLTDSRAFVYMLVVSLLIVFVKKIHKEDKKLKTWNMIVFGFVAVILAVSFVNVDFDNEADDEMIDQIFTQRYIEDGMEEEDIDKAMYAFKFNAYQRVTPQELIGDTFTSIPVLKDIPFEDHIHLLALLFFGSIIIYDHKDKYTDQKEVVVS